jgi:hypothetical protein
MKTTQLDMLRAPPPVTTGGRAIRYLLDGQARGKPVVSVFPGRMQTPDSGSTA